MYFIIFGICFFLTTTFFIYTYYIYQEYKEAKLSETSAKIKAEIQQVNQSISDMEHFVQNLAFNASNIHLNKQAVPAWYLNELSTQYLSYTQEAFGNVAGFGVWYEPFVFDKEKQNFAVYVRLEQTTGELVSQFYDEENPYDYHQTSWYKHFLPDDVSRYAANVNQNDCHFLTQMVQTEDKPLVTASIGTPIYDERQNIVGIATIDCELSQILQSFESLRDFQSGQIVLADVAHNKAIAYSSSDNEFIEGRLDKFADPKFLFHEPNNFDDEIHLQQNLINKETYYIFTAKSGSNLLFTYVVPEKELLSSIYEQNLPAFIMLGIFAAGIMFATFLLVNDTITKPLKILSKASHNLPGNSLKDFDSIVQEPPAEISEIIASFKTAMRNNESLQNFLNDISHMLCIVEIDTYKICFTNSYMEKIFPEVKIDSVCHQALYQRDTPCEFCPLAKLKKNPGQEHASVDVYVKDKDSSFRIRASFLEWDGDDKHAVLFISDITQEYKEKERLEVLAETDELTGILNRRGGLLTLTKLITEEEGVLISVVLLDLNGLKIVNDTCGHQEGDFYLLTAVKFIKKQVRYNDIICRFGGDEFLVILPHCENQTAVKIFEHVNALLKQFLEKEQKAYSGSLAFGVSTFRTGENTDFNKIIAEADQKMYINKQIHYQTSRNR